MNGVWAGSEHISVFSWKQVWQHGKPIHKYLQTVVSICSFFAWGVLKICPEKGFVCGLTTFIVEIRISRWLCRIRVSKWTSLDVACFRDAYRCWNMELIYLYSWKAASNGRCHRHIWTSSALDFWRSAALNHGGCLVSALDSDRMYSPKMFKLGSGAVCDVWVCVALWRHTASPNTISVITCVFF